MNSALAKAEKSILVVLDLQTAVLRMIPEEDRLVARALFLVRMAQLLGIPILQSEQNPSGLGTTDERIAAVLRPAAKIDKTTFSAAAEPAFMDALQATGRRQVVVTGIETHICVSQTLSDLEERGFNTFACVDAVSARTPNRHEAGIERLRACGVALAHSEAIAYEWLGGSSHPLFREALRIVKETPA